MSSFGPKRASERCDWNESRVRRQIAQRAEDSLTKRTKDVSELVGFLLQHQVEAADFAQLPFVQLGDDLLHRPRHGLEIPLSVAVNAVSAFKRNHIAMPVGAFRAGRRLCSPDRYDFVGLFQC